MNGTFTFVWLKLYAKCIGYVGKIFLSHSSHLGTINKNEVGLRSAGSFQAPVSPWSFLVPLIGGRWYIITKLAIYKSVYKWYIITPNWVIIYHLPPIRGTRNNHWVSIPNIQAPKEVSVWGGSPKHAVIKHRSRQEVEKTGCLPGMVVVHEITSFRKKNRCAYEKNGEVA